MSEKVEKGSLILQKQKHLQEFNDRDLRHYSSTLLAGRCGRLLGKLRGLEVIHDLKKIDVFTSDLGVYDETGTNYLLETLEKAGGISIYRSGTEIEKIEENMNTEEEILQISTEIWEEKPSEEEQCSLDVISYLTKLPRSEGELFGHLQNLGYTEPNYRRGSALTTKFNMTKRIDNVPGISEPVVHTPLYASYNVRGIMNKIEELDTHTRINLESALEDISKYQAKPLDQFKIPTDELFTLQKLGVFDISKVETLGGNNAEFVFTPSMWGPFGSDLLKDEQDHVRAMLSCVRYGQFFPTEINGMRFPIHSPSRYLGALIRRGKVGPASPIGSDYIILEKEGIVKLEKSTYKRNQFEMHLIKEDIAIRAKRILDRKTDLYISSTEHPAESCLQTGEFNNPVQTRLYTEAKLKKKVTRSDYLQKEFIKTLRGEK